MQVNILAATVSGGRTPTVKRRGFLSVGMGVRFRGAFLPACLAYAGDFALVGKLTEADTADAVLAQIRMGTATDLASVIFSGRILLRFLLL